MPLKARVLALLSSEIIVQDESQGGGSSLWYTPPSLY